MGCIASTDFDKKKKIQPGNYNSAEGEQSKVTKARRVRMKSLEDSDDEDALTIIGQQSKVSQGQQVKVRQGQQSKVNQGLQHLMQSKVSEEYSDDGIDAFNTIPSTQSHVHDDMYFQSKRTEDSDDESADEIKPTMRQSHVSEEPHRGRSRKPSQRMHKEANLILKLQLKLYAKTKKVMQSSDIVGIGLHMKKLKMSYTSFNDFPYDIKSHYRSSLYKPLLTTGSLFAVCEVLIHGLQEDAYFTCQSDSTTRTVVEDHAELLSDCLQILCSFTDTSPEVREAVSQHPVLLAKLEKKLDSWYQPHMDETALDIENRYLSKTLTLFYLMSAEEENNFIHRLRSIPDYIPVVKKFLSSKSENKRLTAIAALAGVANEAEAVDIAAEPGMVRFLLEQLRVALSDGISSAGWTVVGLSKVVKNLARNDANKQLLVKEGAVPLLSAGLEPDVQKSSNCLERKRCLESLWWLSFDEKNREVLMKDTDLLDIVIGLYNEGPSQDPSSCYTAAEGFLFQMREQLRHENKYQDIANQLLDDTPEHVPETPGHVMMSYQSQQRPVVKMVCDFLRQNGITVWMDIYNMADGEQSTLQTMAEAVEGSVIVAMCVSESYKDSPYCRAEAEYAFMKNKLIIPLKLQRGYTPDGWLGIIQGSKYFYDFTNENRHEEKKAQLLEAVRRAFHGRPLMQTWDSTDGKQLLDNEPRSKPATPNPPPMASSFKDKVRTWTKKDIQAWLSKYNLDGSKLSQLEGEELLYLYDLKSEAPEFFHNTVRSDLQLTGISTMASFNKALTSLPSDTSQM